MGDADNNTRRMPKQKIEFSERPVARATIADRAPIISAMLEKNRLLEKKGHLDA